MLFALALYRLTEGVLKPDLVEIRGSFTDEQIGQGLGKFKFFDRVYRASHFNVLKLWL